MFLDVEDPTSSAVASHRAALKELLQSRSTSELYSADLGAPCVYDAEQARNKDLSTLLDFYCRSDPCGPPSARVAPGKDPADVVKEGAIYEHKTSRWNVICVLGSNENIKPLIVPFQKTSVIAPNRKKRR